MKKIYFKNLNEYLNKKIEIEGFIDSIRDLQYVQFLVVRDVTGKVQVTIEKNEENCKLNEIVSNLTVESTVKIIGTLFENEKVLTSYEYGAPIHYSMTGESIVDNEIFQVFYDYSEKALYADNVKRRQYSYGNQVIDMDNKEHFSEKTLWNGFTTGEVYMTLSVQSLQSEKAQILVKSTSVKEYRHFLSKCQ